MILTFLTLLRTLLITLQEDIAKLQEWSLGLHFNVNNLISVMFYILGIITPGTNAFKSRERKNQY